jgi:hypothetical protein
VQITNTRSSTGISNIDLPLHGRPACPASARVLPPGQEYDARR